MESQPPVPPEHFPDPYGTAPPPPPPPAAAATLPWDHPHPPSLAGFFETVKLVLLRPTEAFTRMARTGSLSRPVVFALVLGIVGTLVGEVYQLAFGNPLEQLEGMIPGIRERTPDMTRTAIFLFTVFVAPFLIAFTLGVTTLLSHGMLGLMGAGRGGLASTFRVLCYSNAAYVWYLVPFLGGLVTVVWWLVPAIRGLSIVHQTSVTRAAIAVLVPLVLCCSCCGFFFFWFTMVGALAR